LIEALRLSLDTHELGGQSARLSPKLSPNRVGQINEPQRLGMLLLMAGKVNVVSLSRVSVKGTFVRNISPFSLQGGGFRFTSEARFGGDGNSFLSAFLT